MNKETHVSVITSLIRITIINVRHANKLTIMNAKSVIKMVNASNAMV